MATATRKSRVGRKRWGELIRFLTTTMKTAQSERVRMTAALRLADILSLREQRELLEIRRELRDAGKAVDAPELAGHSEPSPDAPESVDAFLARLTASRAADAEEDDSNEQ